MCEPIREGQLFVQQQKFGIKSWKKNRAMLYANSGSGVARLEYYESKESGSTSDKGTDRAARRADKRVLRLADCVSVRAAPLEVAPRLCVAFLLETAERHFVFAAELADAAAWVRTLCELAFPKMSSDALRMEMSTAQMEMEENSLYGCRDSANEYWVSIHKTEASERCGLVGSYKLKGDKEDLTLKDPASGNAIYVWPYKLLRRFGRDKTSFTFEAGRRCNSGPGTFMFDTKNGNDIFTIIEESINQTKLNRNSQNYTDGDVQSAAVHCPWSSELYTSMGEGEGAEAAPGPQGNSKREMFDGTPGTPPGQYGHRVHSMEGTDAPAIPPNHPKHGANAKEQADFPKHAMKGRPAFDNAETFTPIIFEPEALSSRQAGPRSSSVRVRPPEDAPKLPEMGMRHWQTSASKTKPLEEHLTLEEVSGCSRSGSANNKSKLSEYLLKPEDGGIMQSSNKQKEDSPKQTPHAFACLFADEEVAKLSLVKSSQNYDRRMAPPQSIVVKPFPISPSLPGMSPTAKSSSSAGSTPPRSPLPRPPLLDPCLARLEPLQDVYADPADSLMLTIKLDDKASASSSSSSHYHDPETENNHPCVTGKLRSNGLLAVAKQQESAPEPVYSDPYEKVEQNNTEAPSSRRQERTPEHIYDEPEGIEKPTASLYDEALQIKGDAWKVQAKPEHAYNEQPFTSPIDSFPAPLPASNPQKTQSTESPPSHAKNTEQAPQLPPKPRQMVAQKFGLKPPTTEPRGWNTANSNNSNSKLCPKPRIAPKPKIENVSGKEPERKSIGSAGECKGVVAVNNKNDKDSKIVLKKPPMKPIMVAVSYANVNL